MYERENATATDPGPHDPDDIQYFELIDNLVAETGTINEIGLRPTSWTPPAAG